MRLRKVKDAYEKLCDNEKYFIKEPKNNKGKWNNVFSNNNDIHIEIGCGKGQFISQMALHYPDINFIAIEKFDSVLLRCSEKIEDMDIPNLRIVLYDAINLNEVFDKEEVSNIYLNFSDPWPKKKHAKRRLTSSLFLDVYKMILKGNGSIIQKTDNRGLFEYSIESFSQNDFYLSSCFLDLHKTDEFNIRTEFEDKWSLHGPIYKLEAKLIKNNINALEE